jgi:ABC-type lipoprotein export system ATPase subunit
MPTVDIVVENKVDRTVRVRQLEALFDVPSQEKTTIKWNGELPLDEKEWSCGLIVGPSGSGKSTILRHVFGEPKRLRWKSGAVIDDFSQAFNMEQITSACSAVGFNTIPSWMRPYSVLSTGEKFRLELARRLLETEGLITIDEFTSVVDRQVAKIGAHAVQKYARRNKKQFVAATCHYDVIDWLQPDWILEPATMSFKWRCLQRRPAIDVEIARISYHAWGIFAPFHYMSANLHRAARCFGLWANGILAAFAGILYRPHQTAKNIYGVSRVVTLPDWQGLGLAFILCDTIASAYKAIGKRVHHYPAHPSFIRAMDRSKAWRLVKRPGRYLECTRGRLSSGKLSFGGRPNATFAYCGAAMADADEARRFIAA